MTTKQTSPTPQKHLCVALVMLLMLLLPLDLLRVLFGSKDSGETSSAVSLHQRSTCVSR